MAGLRVTHLSNRLHNQAGKVSVADTLKEECALG